VEGERESRGEGREGYTEEKGEREVESGEAEKEKDSRDRK
jgi:hypothetical protein